MWRASSLLGRVNMNLHERPRASSRPVRNARARVALVTSTAAIAAVFSFATVGCSSKSNTAPAKSPVAQNGSPAVDVQACARICEASSACGDEKQACQSKCNDWLIERSRAGIAQQAATCAVPRIESACAAEATRGAARALVMCVDEAGRNALRNDKSTLLVAAKAICERGARCGGGSAEEAQACVARLASASPTPRGLGIFGAVKPGFVGQFASCMQSSDCSESAAGCFAAMMGESVEDEGAEPNQSPASPGPQMSMPAPTGTKI